MKWIEKEVQKFINSLVGKMAPHEYNKLFNYIFYLRDRIKLYARFIDELENNWEEKVYVRLRPKFISLFRELQKELGKLNA